MQLKISAHAANQIGDLTLFGEAKWGRQQALTYVSGLFAVFEMLQNYPEAGAVFKYEWPFFKDQVIRSFVYKSHRIFYRAQDNCVEVLAVGSTRQLPEDIVD